MKTHPKKLHVWTALALALLMSLQIAAPAAASLAPSRTSGATGIETVRDAVMVMAKRALENKIVIQKLRDYGVSAEDAQLKLAGMSDQDLHTLASSTKGLPSGSDGTTGAIIGVLVVVILVIVVMRLMHHDVIVK